MMPTLLSPERRNARGVLNFDIRMHHTTLPIPPSKKRKSVFSQGLGLRPLFPDRHLIGPSNPNLSVLETLNSTLVPSSLAENVEKHAQQRRYGVPCADSYHHKCSGLSRMEVVRFREADNYQCRRCRPQNPFHPCTKCGRSFRIGQNGLKCHFCNFPTHLRCTRLTRNERERRSVILDLLPSLDDE